MNQQIIINLPVQNLEKSKGFFTSLGYGLDSQVSSEDVAMVIIAQDRIHVMLTTERFFQSLIDKPMMSARQANELVLCLSCESREELHGLIAKASAAGARIPHPPEDHGFMLDQGFEDLDGHLWNLVWMAADGRG
ncbi:VOC family protein [Massilia aurea]|uniref:VOC family protein n=1 Tax=Massilia aurea TaxID=373040 RepID=UPI00346213EF